MIERLRPLGALRVYRRASGERGSRRKARNAGLARSTGERIVFIDDDVLPTPVFAAEHLAFRRALRRRDRARRGDQYGELRPLCRRRSGRRQTTARIISGPATSRCAARGSTARADASTNRSPNTAGKISNSGMRLRALGTRAVFNKRRGRLSLQTAAAGARRRRRCCAKYAPKRARPCSWSASIRIGASRSRSATRRRSAGWATLLTRSGIGAGSTRSSSALPATNGSTRRNGRRSACLATASVLRRVAACRAAHSIGAAAAHRALADRPAGRSHLVDARDRDAAPVVSGGAHHAGLQQV